MIAGAGRVVVVFCEEYARGSFVSQALTGAGYTVRWVQNAQTALKLADRDRVHGLVADARSEDVLAFLVAGWRRRLPESPIVVLTRPGDVASASLADAALSSPLTVEGITGALQRAFGERLSA